MFDGGDLAIPLLLERAALLFELASDPADKACKPENLLLLGLYLFGEELLVVLIDKLAELFVEGEKGRLGYYYGVFRVPALEHSVQLVLV